MFRNTTAFSTIFAIFLLLNYYILKRTGAIWGYPAGASFYIIFGLCCFSYLATCTMERLFTGQVSALLHTISGMWLGVGLVWLSCLLVYDAVNLMIGVNPAGIRWLLLFTAIGITIYSTINASKLNIKKIKINAPENLKVVQVSDIHIGSVSINHLKRIVSNINSAKPDMVLITGDLVDSRQRLDDQTIDLLNQVEAETFMVSGNHENFIGYDKVIEILEKTKIKVLRNESVYCKGVQLIGIDDSHDDYQVTNQLAKIPVDNSAFTILMYHRPQGLEAAANAGVDLMLSGHTHNGQIVPFNYMVRLKYDKLKGLFQKDKCKLYVTTGTGTWGPKMRLGSQNEIVVFESVR